MLKLTREVEYALMALKHMHASGKEGVTSVREMCDEHNLPFDATAHVLQKLVKAGILTSTQGMHGGYMIEKALDKVSFYDFMIATVGPVKLAACLGVTDNGSPCKILTTCNIMSPLAVLNEKLSDFYRSVTLGELFNSHSPLEKVIRKRTAQSRAG